MKIRFLARGLAMAALALSSGVGAFAQAYPDKPVRIVVPYAAGGANDLIARVLAQSLQADLKQTFLVEDHPGAGGVVGLSYAAKAPADGYTLVIGEPGAMAINPSLVKNISYDPIRDFVAVASLVELPLVIVVNSATRMHNLKDLAAYGAGKNVSYGSAGTGTVQHLSMELLKRDMKLEMTHVPYKGGAPALNDLMGGQVPVLPVSASTAQQPAASGLVVPIAALGARRSATFPTLPTAAEQGYPSLNVTVWQGIFAPAGTPAPIVERLNASIRKALAVPQVRQSLVALGADLADMPREDFARLVAADVGRWAQVVKEAKITND